MCGSIWKAFSCSSTDMQLLVNSLSVYLRAECPSRGDTLACHLGAWREHSTIWDASPIRRRLQFRDLEAQCPALPTNPGRRFNPCARSLPCGFYPLPLNDPFPEANRLKSTYKQTPVFVLSLRQDDGHAGHCKQTNKRQSVHPSVSPDTLFSPQTINLSLINLTDHIQRSWILTFLSLLSQTGLIHSVCFCHSITTNNHLHTLLPNLSSLSLSHSLFHSVIHTLT